MTLNIPALAHPEKLVTVLDGHLITSSLLVAQAFGKEHKNIIQKIEMLEIPDDFTSANFSAHVQNIRAGAVMRDSKIYRMTKDGFMLLVMGFTGKRAMAVKIAYISAFNRMAAELEQQRVNQLAAPAKIPKEHELFMASSAYRAEAHDYVSGVLSDCEKLSREHGHTLPDWKMIDREKAAYGLLSDLLYGVRAELTFNMKMQPEFRILPATATYINPGDVRDMEELVRRGVSSSVLAKMLQAGIERLAGESQ